VEDKLLAPVHLWKFPPAHKPTDYDKWYEADSANGGGEYEIKYEKGTESLYLYLYLSIYLSIYFSPLSSSLSLLSLRILSLFSLSPLSSVVLFIYITRSFLSLSLSFYFSTISSLSLSPFLSLSLFVSLFLRYLPSVYISEISDT
jgi:hypothetical protein